MLPKMRKPEPVWVVDEYDPRAPPQELWDRMTPEQRAEVVAALPSEIPWSEAAPPPEGDIHDEARADAKELLRRHFGRQGRRIYIASNLPVYYPNTPHFSPDLMAVLDVDPHFRNSWMVSEEGKGLDLAFEIHWLGHREKDAKRNVARYASFGIPEYIIFDRRRLRLYGYRLPTPSSRTYEPMLLQTGRLHSAVLGMDLVVEGEQLRFYEGDALVLQSRELLQRLESLVQGAMERAEAEAQRAEAESLRAEAEAHRAEAESLRAQTQAQRAQTEAQRAQTEAQRAEAAERRLAEALREIERLKASRPE